MMCPCLGVRFEWRIYNCSFPVILLILLFPRYCMLKDISVHHIFVLLHEVIRWDFHTSLIFCSYDFRRRTVL